MTAEHKLALEDRRILDDLSDPGSAVAGGARCELLRVRRHRGSVNLEVVVNRASEARYLFIKRLRSEAQTRYQDAVDGRGRPRLKGVPNPATRLAHEATTLNAITAMVARSGDESWFDVGVVTLEPALGALYLERVEQPTFAELVTANDARLEVATHRLGSWLRSFHALPRLAHTGSRLSTAAEMETIASELLDYLERQGQGRRVGIIRKHVVDSIRRLPAEMTTCLGHGDFAAHNVFVDKHSRIAVFDTSGDWATPPHLDLAYFMVLLDFAELKGTFPTRTKGSRAGRLKSLLVEGYGADAPGPSELSAFEIAVLLDKWASIETGNGGSPVRRIAKRVRREMVVRRIFDAVVERCNV